MDSKRALIVSSQGSSILGRLPKVFRQAGCVVSLLAPPVAMIWKSRHLARRFVGPPIPAEMGKVLQSHLAVAEYDLVIVADEPLLWALAPRSEEPWIKPWFPLGPGHGALETALSKFALALAASRSGVNIPRFQICDSESKALRAAEDIGYPVVLKADRGSGGSGVRCAATPAALSLLFWELSGPPLMVQAFVNGKAGATHILFNRGKRRSWVSAYLHETWPNGLSPATAYEFMDHPDLTAMIDAVGQITGFHGLCGIDWIHDSRNSRFLLLELNPRPTSGFYLGHHAGVDFSRSIQDWFSGRDSIQAPHTTRKLVRMFPQGIYRAIGEGAPIHALDAFRDAPWDDPAVVAEGLLHVAFHRLPESLKKLGRRMLLPPTPS